MQQRLSVQCQLGCENMGKFVNPVGSNCSINDNVGLVILIKRLGIRIWRAIPVVSPVTAMVANKFDRCTVPRIDGWTRKVSRPTTTHARCIPRACQRGERLGGIVNVGGVWVEHPDEFSTLDCPSIQIGISLVLKCVSRRVHRWLGVNEVEPAICLIGFSTTHRFNAIHHDHQAVRPVVRCRWDHRPRDTRRQIDLAGRRASREVQVRPRGIERNLPLIRRIRLQTIRPKESKRVDRRTVPIKERQRHVVWIQKLHGKHNAWWLRW